MATKNLSDSKAMRWTALAIVSFTMLCGYFIADVMAPLKPMLEQQLKWSSSEYGFFTSAYGWFNVFLLMLFFGGIILDKMGVRFTGVMAASIMVAGTALKWFAISTTSLDGMMILGWKAQIMLAAVGFAIFGVGVEVAGITVTKVIVKWFKGKEMALAMGLQVAMARIGTGMALGLSVPIATSLGHVSKSVFVGLILISIGLITFILYTFVDKKLDASIDSSNEEPEEPFKMADVKFILTNKGWWYIAILCVLFYSAVFPFLKYASDLMVNKFGVAEALAGTIPAILPFGTILFTPIFGGIYDKKGKGVVIMIIGSVLISATHLLFAIPFLNQVPVAYLLMVILGIGFSLVPSAMWPSVPKIIPENKLGTAYALIFLVQNVGLMFVPGIIGYVLGAVNPGVGAQIAAGDKTAVYNYTIPMLIFAGLSILSIFIGFLLKAEDTKMGYGIDKPNIVAD
jgi:MFS family permease